MQNHQEAKSRILEAADTLFHKQGYTNTGINQIIKEAKVAKASLYYHFATKDDLCVAYLMRRNIIWNEKFYIFLKNKKTKILATFDFLMEDNNTFDFRGCSFINMLSETPPEKEKIFEQIQKQKSGLLLFFESELNNEHNDLAYTIYSLFENAILESQLFRSQEPVMRLKNIVANLLKTI